jgi:hypothetical protein
VGYNANYDDPASWPYEPQEYLLSGAERDFFGALQVAVGSQALIFPKMRLEDVIRVFDPQQERFYSKRIAYYHVDFVLCDPVSSKPLAGIELDDKSHETPIQQRRDNFKDKVFAVAMLPLLRFPVKGNFDADEIREKIASHLPIAPLCPKCGIHMEIKTAQKGYFAGQSFWGCVNYPECTEKIPTATSRSSSAT